MLLMYVHTEIIKKPQFLVKKIIKAGFHHIEVNK